MTKRIYYRVNKGREKTELNYSSNKNNSVLLSKKMIFIKKILKNIKAIFRLVFYCLNILKTKRLFKALSFNFLILTTLLLTFLIPFKTDDLFSPKTSLQEAKAASIIWDGSESSDWTVGDNWIGGVVPISTDDVFIDGNYLNAPTLDLTSGTTTINSLSLGVTIASTLTLSNGNSTTNKLLVTGDVNIGAIGTLTHTANTTAQTHVINLETANLTIAEGGTIDVDEKGFQQAEGSGQGASGGTSGGSGAGYGGNGGYYVYAGGTAYGSITEPTNIGSGGGSSSTTHGGDGGGAVKLTVSGTTTISGSITADGGNGSAYVYRYSGGGSGGSIYITTGTLVGGGTITADGGNNGGGGGGGRIAVHYTTNPSTVIYQTYGGDPDTRSGGAGTIYLKESGTNGDLLIDNNNNDNDDETYMGKTPLLVSDWTFDNIAISGAGKLDANGYNLIVYNNFTNSDGTFTHSDKTVTFAGTTTGNVIGGLNFYNLVINGTGGEWTSQDVVTVDNNLTLTDGTLVLSNALIVDSNLTLTNGILDLSDQNLTVTGTFSNDSTLKLIGSQTISFTNDLDSGIVEYYGSESVNSFAVGNDYYNLTISGTGTYPVTSALNIDNNFIFNSGTFDYSYYAYYKEITIDHTKVDETLSNYPMLFNVMDLNLKTTANEGQVFNANGYDIIFTDTDGVPLSHEIEKYVASTGEFISWVKIPSLSSTEDTTIRVYYGNSSVATSQEDVAGVWSNDYLGAWHFDNNTNDSTLNNYDGTASGGVTYISGKVDSGIRTDASAEYINLPVIEVGSTYTLNYWSEFPLNSIGTWRTLFQRQGGTYHHTIVQLDGQLGIYNGSFFSSGYDIDNLSAGWHYITAVASSGTTKFYIDGSTLVGTSNSVVIEEISRFGNHDSGQQWGSFDEVRISNTARTAGWISTTYNNQFSPSSFYGVSDQVAIPATEYTTTIGGDFTNVAGSFDGTNTVVFDDNTRISHIYGDTTFNNFTCATAGKTLQFEDTKTTTITGVLTFTGESENLLTLRSTVENTQWIINPTGTRSVSFVDVKDSNNIHATAISPAESTDSGNTINWDFVSIDHFEITGDSTQTVGASQEITITAVGDDGNTYTDYTGDYNLTFSGANISPSSNDPTCEDKDSADINFGTATTLTFTAGEATAIIKLYTVEDAEIEVDEGGVYSTTGDASYDLNVAVSSSLSATSIAINDGVGYTNNNSTTLALSAANAIQMKFSNDNSTYSTYESYNTSKTWDITNAFYGGNTNDETKTVYAIFNDIYGNESTAISDTIIYDTTLPTGASIILTSILADSITANVSGATDALSGLASSPYDFQNITSSTRSSYQAGTYWISNSLEPNTQYFFRVDYKDNADNETQSATQAAYTLSNIPTNLSLDASLTYQITVNWNNNSNPDTTQYYIENITQNTNSGWTTGTSWVSTSLSCGKEYIFRIKARNNDEAETSFTSTVSATTTGCGGGGLPPGATNPPVKPSPSPDNPEGELDVFINNDNKYAYNRDVTLTFLTGSDTLRMAISNSSNFENASQIPYEKTFNWHLSTCKKVKKSGEQSCKVYAKFYTQYGQASKPVSDSIILKEDPPILDITVIQDAYEEGQNVIIAGVSERLPKIVPSLDEEELVDIIPNRYGNWTLDLGQFSKGSYELLLSAISEAKIPITLTADILVVEVVPSEEPEIPEDPETPEDPEIPEDPETPEDPEIPEDDDDDIDDDGTPDDDTSDDDSDNDGDDDTPDDDDTSDDDDDTPDDDDTSDDDSDNDGDDDMSDDDNDNDIPEETSPVFDGDWDLISPAQTGGFVFMSAPKEAIEEIKKLAEIFPEIEEKLKEMEIEDIDDLKISDLKKLEEELLLPNITKIVNLQNEEITSAISFEELKEEEKEKMPEDIIFVKAAGGKIDIDINLKMNFDGSLRKEISTISGQTLNFFIKPKSKTETIKGTLVFKSIVKNKENLSDSSNLIFKTASANEGTKLVISEFEYSDTDNDGIYTTNIKVPSAEGEFDVLTEIDYQDQSLENKDLDLTIISNSEGYVYEKQGNKELRIPNAKISLYQLNQETDQYELFSANEYEQKNPITTDLTGRYFFIIPQGTYYFTIEAKDYLTHQTESFEAKEGFNINRIIELKKDSSETETKKEEKDGILLILIYLASFIIILLIIILVIKKIFSRDENENNN